MLDLDPIALAKWQIARDRDRTQRFADTFARKVARMRPSPLAFLRGAAPLFYELLAARPELARCPDEEGWLIGDLHIENFGAFVAEAAGRQPAGPTFDLNDFDDAIIGPLRLDVLRLSTSLLLAARELGANGGQALEMVRELIDSWDAHLMKATAMPPLPRPVHALIEQVRTRSRTDLLDARTRVVRGRRRFVRGPRYAALPTAVEKGLEAAFGGYVESLPEELRPEPEQLEIVDAAYRIAGTGSLGVLRVAVLVAGKGGPDGGWIFDLKEQGPPSGAAFGRVPDGPGATRVEAALRACLSRPPRLVGTTRLAGMSMLGRRLSPQDDKLDLGRIAGADLPPLARYLGALLGNAHRRGAAAAGAAPPKRSWSAADRASIVDNAIRLAGIHEAVYLAYCAQTA
ncbi:MAG TPA: DUF2252 family protein [Haliangiales bacterium]|nr:DUF2252 family protein [Haliangiales bacterium]